MFKFTGEPNQVINVPLGTIYLRFDDKGEMELSDGHPALERMKSRFSFEEIERKEVNESDLLTCRKCGFQCDNRGDMLQHHKQEHPKEG